MAPDTSTLPPIVPQALATGLTLASDPVLIPGRRFAELLAVSAATFARMKAANKLPRPIELSRGCHRWRLDEVRAWIEAGCPPIREWEARNAGGQRRHGGRCPS